MRIDYDPESDAMYIRLVEGAFELRTVRLTDDINLDMGPGERLIGIEILDARRVLAGGNLPDLVVANLRVKAA
jgi:uncharacterized protein YuzE